MMNYLQLAPKYLSAHKKISRLAMASVILSVALVVGIISILDSLIVFERQHILDTEGNYHILVRTPSEREISMLQSRFDILNSGILKEYKNGSIEGEECALGAISSNFAANLNFRILIGSYPEAKDEIMLENWYAAKAGLKPGDTVAVAAFGGTPIKYRISGIYKDWGVTKATSLPIVFLSIAASSSYIPEKSSFFILFKDGISIRRAEQEIKTKLKLNEDRIGYNEGLLALMLQSGNNRVVQYIVIGGGLFTLVLLTAVVMIYNTFNISVMERIKQFGLLRCIGSSEYQIKRLVRREGFLIALKAIPPGLALGYLLSIICLAILKLFNRSIYGAIGLFRLSSSGILAGIILGFLTVLLALLSPARKASRVSAVSAMTGNNDFHIKKKKKVGLLTKLLPIEVSMGILNAIGRKKTLFLMSCSIAFSIILFLLFQVMINPDVLGARPLQCYSADLRLASREGIGTDIYQKLQKLEEVKNANGRMSTTVIASIALDRLTPQYKKDLGDFITEENGYIINPEKSRLISYDDTQFKWAKAYLTEGSASEAYLNKNNGIIAVNKIYRMDELTKTTSLKLGDKVRIKTANGIRELTVLAIADSIPYSTNDTIMTAFITTEQLFREISTDNAYKEIDVQLKKSSPDRTVEQIKALAGHSIKVGDRRQMNQETNNAFITVTIFIYGFVTVIALISILNIMNTMNTSIAAKMRNFGIMRAVGMSGSQLSRMVVTEAATYCLTGCLFGIILGVFLRKAFTDFLQITWNFPLLQVLSIITACLLASLISIIKPMQQMKARGISDVIITL